MSLLPHSLEGSLSDPNQRKWDCTGRHKGVNKVAQVTVMMNILFQSGDMATGWVPRLTYGHVHVQLPGNLV